MTYNFRLFWRMAYCSIFRASNTHGQLKPKRIFFLLLFYTVWPAWTVFTWLCFGLDDLLFPGHKTQPVERPLFILGNFRSGSTFLHRLLSRDTSNFTSLRTWDIFITPSITQRKISQFFDRIDNFFGAHLKRFLLNIDQRSLGQVRIHRISLFEPEEDENILLHAWSTYFVAVLFPFLDELPPYQFFDEKIPAEERQRIMAFYKSMVQRHLYATGAKHFVSKNPAFSAKIETLLDAFPDANIIYLARNPLDMLPSTISWLSYAWNVFSVPLEPHPFRQQVVNFTQYWYRHPLQVIDRLKSPNHLIISYDDLVSQPEAVIRNFYTLFGYPQQENLEWIVAQAVADTQNHISDHYYSYVQMGFTRQQIVDTYRDIFERFGFDQREADSPAAVLPNPEARPLTSAD